MGLDIGIRKAKTRFLRRLSVSLNRLPAAKLALLGYLSYSLVGWLLLCVPFVQRGAGVRAIDNLFTCVSAVSTTGLVTVSVADSYNIVGQIIVLALIQLGGIGYMTLGSFVVLSRKTELSATRTAVASTVFSLPESFRIDKFIRSVIYFTVAIEMAGVVALYLIFRSHHEPHAMWSAAFHSVSAFCTAGFSLNNNSFEGYAGDFWLNLTISALSCLGAVGFIVCVDYWRMFRRKVKHVTLTSKVILWSAFWLLTIGTVLIFLTEPSIETLPLDRRLLAAFFQAMTSMTTVGFNTISISSISRATLLLITVLMVIGASPSGTGGGLKSTTFSAMVGVMRSALRGQDQVRFWNRPVPQARIWVATASLGFYLLMLVAGTYCLELTEKFSFEKNLFEAASALGTVGLSTGITADLSNLGKLVITFLMFCGRLGPLTFGIAVFARPLPAGVADNDLAV